MQISGLKDETNNYTAQSLVTYPARIRLSLPLSILWLCEARGSSPPPVLNKNKSILIFPYSKPFSAIYHEVFQSTE